MRFLKNVKGSAAIETAILLPVYLLLIFGVIEFGYFLWADISLRYGAYYGARYALVNAPTTSAATQNFAYSKSGFAEGGPITYVATINTSNAQIKGTLTYKFLVLPLPSITTSIVVYQDIPPS